MKHDDDGNDIDGKIIEAIYRGACDPLELRRALELISARFDSPGVVLAELDATQPNNSLVVGVNAVDAQFFLNYESYADLDPAPRAFIAQQAGKASLTDRMFTKDELKKFVFLHEFSSSKRCQRIDRKLAFFVCRPVRAGVDPAKTPTSIRRRRCRPP